MTDSRRFMSTHRWGSAPKVAVVACLAALPLAGCQTDPVAPAAPTLIAAGNGDSAAPSISGDGRYVAFASTSTDLVSQPDPNGAGADIFLADTVSNTVQRITTSTTGTSETLNNSIVRTAISADGRYVAFASAAPDLSAEIDTDSNVDIYRWDRVTGTTIRVSDGIGAAGSGQLDMSDSGDVVAWAEFAPVEQIWAAKVSAGALNASPIADPVNFTVTAVVVPGDGEELLYSVRNQIGEGGRIFSIDTTTFASQLVLGGADPLDRQIRAATPDGDTLLYSKIHYSQHTSESIRHDRPTGTETVLNAPGTILDLSRTERYTVRVEDASTPTATSQRLVWADAQGGSIVIAQYVATPPNNVSGSYFSQVFGLADSGTVAFAAQNSAGTNRSAVYTFHP